MEEKFTIYDLLKATKRVDKFGELAVLIQFINKGFNVEWHGSKHPFDILADKLEIEVKSCNYDNKWAKKDNLLGGWDRINPEKFQYLVCVSFNGNFNDVRYFIFSKEEAKSFPNVAWKKSPGLKNLTLRRGDGESEHFVKSSENRWDKIKK